MAKPSLDKLSVMMELELACESLESYFSLKRKGKSDGEIIQEFSVDDPKDPAYFPLETAKPINFAQMLGDFTDCFLYDKDIRKWGSKQYIQDLDEDKKYPLRVLGKRVKSKDGNDSEEERAARYVASQLRDIIGGIKKRGEEEKKAYEKAEKFFRSMRSIAGKELVNYYNLR